MNNREYKDYEKLFNKLLKKSSQYHNVDENTIMSSRPTKYNGSINFICKILREKGADGKTIARLINKTPRVVSFNIQWADKMFYERFEKIEQRKLYKNYMEEQSRLFEKYMKIHDKSVKNANAHLLTYDHLIKVIKSSRSSYPIKVTVDE